jgi:cell wall assembly regulator SMI1
MRDLWQRIGRALQAHAPDTATTLAPAATDQEIAALEAAIGLTLPADLRASLKIHNGQRDPSGCHWFTAEGVLLGTSEIAERWRMVTVIDEELRSHAAPRQGPWWKASCIPFTDADGDMLCVDMDPDLVSQVGEVVCHVHDGELGRGLSASFGDWLSSVANRLDGGRFFIDEDGYLWLDDEAPPQ